MSVTVTVTLSGVPIPVELDDDALAAIAAAVTPTPQREPASEFLTIPEAADLLRCKRGRVDDLLSQRRLPRVKDGTRTLIRRSDLDAYLNGGPERRTR